MNATPDIDVAVKRSPAQSSPPPPLTPSPLGPDRHATPGEAPAMQLAGKRVHFVGIGGSGMSGLARIVQRAGGVCSGSDQADSDVLGALRRQGVTVTLEQTAESVPAQCDLVVISAAIKYDHPEVVEATRRGLPVLKYAQMLGALMLGRCAIAIAGTHGKSSTTSMTGHVLIQAGVDPTIIVGANCTQIGGGARTGALHHGHNDKLPGVMVAEACEYDRSFHHHHPALAAILNVEEDHLDTYGTLDAIVESFHHFAGQLPGKPWAGVGGAGGYLLIQHELAHRLKITAGLDCTVETLGFAPQADWRVEVSPPEVSLPTPGGTEAGDPALKGTASPGMAAKGTASAPNHVTLSHQGQVVAQWRSPLPGDHMAYNAAAAAILAHQVGAAWERIIPALESFAGLDRRMQRLGTRTLPHGGQVLVIDDYGHHPTEIDTTLRALRRHYRPGRLICVFQPHQHSRTRFLMEQFAASFSQADIVIVPHIYFVRDSEQERKSVSAADLVDRIRQRGGQAMHLYPFAAIVEQLQLIARPGDLLVTMGAGDVWKVARDFLTGE